MWQHAASLVFYFRIRFAFSLQNNSSSLKCQGFTLIGVRSCPLIDRNASVSLAEARRWIWLWLWDGICDFDFSLLSTIWAFIFDSLRNVLSAAIWTEGEGERVMAKVATVRIVTRTSALASASNVIAGVCMCVCVEVEHSSCQDWMIKSWRAITSKVQTAICYTL